MVESVQELIDDDSRILQDVGITVAGSTTCGPGDAVTVHGDEFRCNQRPFQFIGVNSRELVHMYKMYFKSGGTTGDPLVAARVMYDHLYQANLMGASVMRVYLPREAYSFDGDAEQLHAFYIQQLEYLLDFATSETLPGGSCLGSDPDYRKCRKDANGDALPPPAPI